MRALPLFILCLALAVLVAAQPIRAAEETQPAAPPTALESGFVATPEQQDAGDATLKRLTNASATDAMTQRLGNAALPEEEPEQEASGEQTNASATVFDPLFLRKQLLPPTTGRLWPHDGLEELLPAGAWAYLRVNSPRELLEDLDLLLSASAPEEALSPETRVFFTQPQPLLALFGAQYFKHYMLVTGIEQVMGLDVNRPAGLAVYSTQQGPSAVAALPVKDPALLSQWIQRNWNILEAESELRSGKEIIHVLIEDKGKVRHLLHLLPAEDYLFVSPETSLLQDLLLANLTGPLASDPVMAKAVRRYAGDNLTLVLSPASQRQMLPALLYAYSPQAVRPMIMGAVREFSDGLDDEDRANLLLSLHWRLGVDSMDDFERYLTTAATAAYSVLHDRLGRLLANLEGASLALDLSGGDQKASLALFHGSVNATAHPAPLPMDAVLRALPLLPSDCEDFVAHGRLPAPEPGLVQTMLRAVASEFANQGLESSFFEDLERAYGNQTAFTPLGAQLDFSIEAELPQPEAESFQAQTLEEFVKHYDAKWSFWASPRPDRLLVLPERAAAMLPESYVQLARTSMRDVEIFWDLLQTPFFNIPKLFTLTSHTQKYPLGQGVTQILYEQRYTTDRGFFGYQQHELIHRKMVNFANRNGYTIALLGLDGQRLVDMLKTPQAPAHAASQIAGLLSHAPRGADSLRVVRWPRLLADALVFLDQAERLVQQQIDAYLDHAVEVFQVQGVDQGLAQLRREYMPLAIRSINLTPQGELYAVMPGGWTFPRQPILPALRELLAPVLQQTEGKGGAAVFTLVENGLIEKTAVYNSEALSLLIKNGVNAFFQRYMTPEGRPELDSLIDLPRDGQELETQETLLVNPFWAAVHAEPWDEFSTGQSPDEESLESKEREAPDQETAIEPTPGLNSGADSGEGSGVGSEVEHPTDSAAGQGQDDTANQQADPALTPPDSGSDANATPETAP